MLFGRDVGYDISSAVCGGLALLVTASFVVLHLLDRITAHFTGKHKPELARKRFIPSLQERERNLFMKTVINTADAPQAIGPYSQAVVAKGFVFISGQIPIDPRSGNLVAGDIRDQTKQVMENGKAILAAAGCGMAQVVKATIYLKNMADFGAVNEVYGSYFSSEPPARATVEVARLPKDVAVEIDFIAVQH